MQDLWNVINVVKWSAGFVVEGWNIRPAMMWLAWLGFAVGLTVAGLLMLTLLVLLLLFWMLNLKCRTVLVMVMMIGCCTRTEVRIFLLWSLTFLWVLCHCSTWFDDCMLMCCNAMLLALVDWLVIKWFDHGCLFVLFLC